MSVGAFASNPSRPGKVQCGCHSRDADRGIANARSSSREDSRLMVSPDTRVARSSIDATSMTTPTHLPARTSVRADGTGMRRSVAERGPANPRSRGQAETLERYREDRSFELTAGSSSPSVARTDRVPEGRWRAATASKPGLPAAFRQARVLRPSRRTAGAGHL